jgi:hypothetical protein
LLGDDAGEISNASKFAVSRDHRNTFRARLRLQAQRRAWLALGGDYGSGLPVEDVSGLSQDFLLAQYDPEILHQVNLETGRVRPNFSLDAGGVL